MLKKIGLGLLAILVVIQFFRIDKENPEAIPRKDFITQTSPPEAIQKLLKNACYDCHSSTTKYPWYSNVAPISWWLKDHVNEGREELNFSNWADYPLKKQIHKMEECWEMIEEGEMPLESYLITHSEAELTTEEKELLIEWFKGLESALAEPTAEDDGLNNGKKWVINNEVTVLVNQIISLLKENRNETDLAKINALGIDIENKLIEIGEAFDGKRNVLDQLNTIHGEVFLSAPNLKTIDNIEDAKSLMLSIEENLNTYSNFFETKKVLELNGEQKWEANPETTEGIEKMLVIISEDVEQGRISHYAAMGERLNIEIKTIFSSCTMKGEGHEQLHLYIMPLVDLCEKLEAVETEDEASVLQKNILKRLNLYSQYFK
ncbi:MAG: heme-binding domain-containing protein [Vicingaceae bacterium]|nr:heme-binding domain-containing protein [Vicingaceae bacterium]